jgi:hypothetical protein
MCESENKPIQDKCTSQIHPLPFGNVIERKGYITGGI